MGGPLLHVNSRKYVACLCCLFSPCRLSNLRGENHLVDFRGPSPFSASLKTRELIELKMPCIVEVEVTPRDTIRGLGTGH